MALEKLNFDAFRDDISKTCDKDLRDNIYSQHNCNIRLLVVRAFGFQPSRYRL